MTSAPTPAGYARGFLVLEDGSVFPGRSIGAPGIAFGEAVFTTAMTGYQEIVTDPSYTEQVVAFTAPMVGNYGVSPGRSESERTHAKAVLMRRSSCPDWPRWLAAERVVALDELDTRTLVLRLRERGAMRAAAVAGAASAEEVLARVRAEPPMAGRALVARVSTARPYTVGRAGARLAVVDYGCKRSLVARLVASGARVTIYPHDTDAATILRARPAGVVLSNGPGDPGALPAQAAVVAELLGRVPLLGVCLGHQLLGVAAGFQTYKLPFGHRGANHPVLELATNRVLVTSQNHGFALAGDGPEITHVSLYDGTVEGLNLRGDAAQSLQFHPEAGPGPHDAFPLVERWVEEVRGYAEAA